MVLAVKIRLPTGCQLGRTATYEFLPHVECTIQVSQTFTIAIFLSLNRWRILYQLLSGTEWTATTANNVSPPYREQRVSYHWAKLTDLLHSFVLSGPRNNGKHVQTRFLSRNHPLSELSSWWTPTVHIVESWFGLLFMFRCIRHTQWPAAKGLLRPPLRLIQGHKGWIQLRDGLVNISSFKARTWMWCAQHLDASRWRRLMTVIARAVDRLLMTLLCHVMFKFYKFWSICSARLVLCFVTFAVFYISPSQHGRVVVFQTNQELAGEGKQMDTSSLPGDAP